MNYNIASCNVVSSAFPFDTQLQMEVVDLLGAG
jgi:hypothetical protein